MALYDMRMSFKDNALCSFFYLTGWYGRISWELKDSDDDDAVEVQRVRLRQLSRPGYEWACRSCEYEESTVYIHRKDFLDPSYASEVDSSGDLEVIVLRPPESRPTAADFATHSNGEDAGSKGGDRSPPIILWFHGGGYCVGDPRQPDIEIITKGLLGRPHSETYILLLVAYRQAPRYKFPAAPEDGVAALRWAYTHGASVGGDPERITVAGNSSGGAIAAVVHQRAVALRIPIRSAALFQPFLCPTAGTGVGEAADAGEVDYSSRLEFGDCASLPSRALEWWVQAYIKKNGCNEICKMHDIGRDPRCTPVKGTLTHDLAPVVVVTGSADMLRDEGFEYFKALSDSGVEAYHASLFGTHSFAFLCDETGVQEAWGRIL